MYKIIYAGKHPLMTGVSRHMHTSWELIYCTSGNGQLIFDDRTLTYSENDVAVIPPYLPHSNKSSEGFTNLHINLSDAPLALTEPLIVPADQNGFLRSAFSAAFYYYSSGSEPGEFLLPLYGQLIAAFLKTSQPAELRSDVVLQIENHILQHFQDCNYDLHAYLAALPFSTEYLTRLFKRETGMTPLQYLKNRRLENAASILAVMYGKGNISETARLCGFSDPLYFSRQFRKKYGVSPREYMPGEEVRVTDSDSMKTML